VFRNETLDATHLAEFHQIEGLIADRNLGLGHLKKVIKEFFNKIGITQLWFKPAYNPYTEPSMEIFGYHPILKKKVEIGNSGIFRPEMLRPMVLLFLCLLINLLSLFIPFYHFLFNLLLFYIISYSSILFYLFFRDCQKM
jgi:hypothetical protein